MSKPCKPSFALVWREILVTWVTHLILSSLPVLPPIDTLDTLRPSPAISLIAYPV